MEAAAATMLEAGVGRFHLHGPSLAALLADMWASLAVALAALATLPSLIGRLQVLILRLGQYLPASSTFDPDRPYLRPRPSIPPYPGDQRRPSFLSRPATVTGRQLLPQIELPDAAAPSAPTGRSRSTSPLSYASTSPHAAARFLSMLLVPAAGSSSDSSIQDLLSLIYFRSLFDVKAQSEFIATMAR